MKNQIFIQKLEENKFKINNYTYEFEEMEEEALLLFSSVLQQMLEVQKSKVEHTRFILANTIAKKPTLQEASTELQLSLKTKIYKEKLFKWESSVETAKGLFERANNKVHLIQDCIMELAIYLNKLEEQVSVTNLDSYINKTVTLREAKMLTQSDDWVYTEALSQLV